MTRSIAALFVLLLPACGQVSAPFIPEADAHSRDTIHIGAQDPKLAFIKVEAVQETDGGPMIGLTGRVAFDEDHTQRVSSPIDGRATRLFVSPGDIVKAGQ